LQNQNLPQLFVEKKDYSVTIDELLAKNLEITQPYKFIVDNHYFIGLPGVFSPEIFGGVMRAQLAIPIKNGADVLEIGPGTGYFPVLAVLAGANQVIAIDINHTAVANTRLNAKRYQLEHKIKVHQGDIFAPLKDKERFDVIFWNIPFSHSDKDQLSELEQSIYDPNHLLLTRYLSEAYHYLKPNGVLYLGYSPSHGDIDYLCTLAQHLQLEFNTLYKVGRSEELQFALYAFKKKPTVN
jgi:methylase of polypeptide subunit release factors